MTSGSDSIAGRYRLVRVLGRGGMAEVWEAHDETLRRRVAVKLFRTTGSGADARRIAAEMHTLAGLDHPNLITVYDAGTDGDRTFLVMELLMGPTLADRIRAPGGLDPADVAVIAADIAAGLAYIHRRDVVHRDVKPANVLLPSRGHDAAVTAKLADFGIAQRVGQDRLTQTGMTVGTARYLAPEQVTGKPIGPAADIYALGIVVLEMLGRGPSWTGTPVEVALARLAGPPEVPADLGPLWQPLLTAMTATDPAARPTAAQVRERLALPARTLLLPTTAPSGRRRVAIAAGVVLAAVVATVVAVALATGPSGGADPGGRTASTPVTSAPPASTPSAPTSSATPSTAVATTPPDTGEHVPPGQTKSKGKGKGPGK